MNTSQFKVNCLRLIVFTVFFKINSFLVCMRHFKMNISMLKNAIENQFQLANLIPYKEKLCFQHCSRPSYILEKSSPFSPQTTPVTLLTKQHLGLLFLYCIFLISL